jgi:quercetin dioxygenase-like cupin family protein
MTGGEIKEKTMQSTSLTDLTADELDRARVADGGRSVRQVHGVAGQRLRQVLVSLAVGGELPEHDRPGEATLQVLRGRVRFTTVGGDAWEGGPGDLLAIPDERHAVSALEDSAVLLTIVG